MASIFYSIPWFRNNVILWQWIQFVLNVYTSGTSLCKRSVQHRLHGSDIISVNRCNIVVANFLFFLSSHICPKCGSICSTYTCASVLLYFSLLSIFSLLFKYCELVSLSCWFYVIQSTYPIPSINHLNQPYSFNYIHTSRGRTTNPTNTDHSFLLIPSSLLTFSWQETWIR